MSTLKKTIQWMAIAIFCTSFMTFTAVAQSTTNLTDSEIASIAITSNQIDVDYGKMALKKSKSQVVKNFAQAMIDDHKSIIKQAEDLDKKLGVTPRDNTTSQKLLRDAKVMTANLKDKKDKDFDRAYIDNEISYHEAVISTVKNVLIPQSTNDELKAFLVKISPLLDAHLEMAKRAQAELK